MYSNPLPIFYLGCLFTLLFVKVLHIFWILDPQSDIGFEDIFSHSEGSFHFLDSVNWLIKYFYFNELPICLCFLPLMVLLVSYRLPNPGSRIFTYVLSKNFIVLALKHRFLIHVELIILCGLRKGSYFVLLHVISSCPSKRLFPSHGHPSWKSVGHKCEGLFLDFQFYPIDLCVYPFATATLS